MPRRRLHSAKQIGQVIYQAGMNLTRNDGVVMAGYLTFLTMLSLFPFLVLVAAAFGVIGERQTGAHFIDFLFAHLPAELMHSLSPRINEITSGPPQGFLTLSVVGALWTSSSAVEGIRTVLNRAYHVGKPPHYFMRRLISIGQVLGFTVLIIATMLVLVFAPTVINGFIRLTGMALPIPIERLFVKDFIFIGALVLFVGVAGLYRVLPNVKQHWHAVLPGAALVVLLWLSGSWGVSFYLKSLSSVNVVYGSLSGVIATMIFFFVMNLIFIYGAEFNHALLTALGRHIVEKETTQEKEVTPSRRQKQRGFSLVELSIVLVILGLLTGGILAGQSLIRASELRSYITDMQRYTAAINSFRGKYFQYPGDMNNATAFWGSAGGTGADATCQNTASTTTATCNGNGDGWIDDSAVTNDERFRFWQHLGNAGLIEGSYTGATDSGTPGSFALTPGKNVPALKGNATFTLIDYQTASGYTAGSFSFAGLSAGHYIEFRASGSGVQPLAPDEAWNIDTKMDDGKPGYGIISGPVSSWTGSTGCTTSDDPTTATYSLTNTSKICRFNYRYN